MAPLILMTLLLVCACSIDRRGARPYLVPADASGTVHHDAASAGSNADSGPDAIARDAASTSDASDAASRPDASMPQDAGSPGFTPPPGQIGAPCTQDDDCMGFMALCIESTGVLTGGSSDVSVPNGYCVVPCAAQVGTFSCGQDARCVSAPNFDVCVRTCTDDDGCRRSEGYVCDNGLCALPGL